MIDQSHHVVSHHSNESIQSQTTLDAHVRSGLIKSDFDCTCINDDDDGYVVPLFVITIPIVNGMLLL